MACPNPAPRRAAWALLVSLCGCSPYGASLLTRATYYPQPVYQPQPTPPPPAPYYATRPTSPYYSPPPSLFEPPPGPITDSCFPELHNRLEARQRVLALGAAGQQYLPLADLKVRRTWEACQSQYLAALEKRANANPPGGTPPPPTPPAPEPSPTAGVAAELALDAPPAPPDQMPAAANADAPTVDTNPTPTETAPPPKAPEPKPRKLSAADRQAIADRKAKQEAERAQKKAEKKAKAEEAAAAEAQLVQRICGPAPERSAWNGIYIGLKRAFEKIAFDPDSVDYLGCSEARLKEPPACWITTCSIRAKNALGAKIIKDVRFSMAAGEWTAF